MTCPNFIEIRFQIHYREIFESVSPLYSILKSHILRHYHTINSHLL
jgi:hypothetical protein